MKKKLVKKQKHKNAIEYPSLMLAKLALFFHHPHVDRLDKSFCCCAVQSPTIDGQLTAAREYIHTHNMYMHT